MSHPEAVADVVNYDMAAYLAPSYKLSRVFMQSGGTSVTLSTAGGQESVFEIPSKVINLPRSMCRGLLRPGQAAADKQNVLVGDCISMWRDAMLYTKGGLYLTNVPYVNNYTRMVLPWEIKVSDFLTLEGPSQERIAGSGAAVGADIAMNGFWSGIFPCRKPINRNYRFGYSPTALGAGVGTDQSTGPAAYRYGATKNEPQYFILSENKNIAAVGVITTANMATGQFYPLASGSNVAYPRILYRIPLGLIKNTLLAVDKDLFFDEVIYFRVVYDSYQRMGFQAPTNIKLTPVADPTLVSFKPLVNGVVSTAELTSMTIDEIDMLLAVEQNEVLIAQIIQKKRTTGISMLMPYVYMNKVSPSAANSQIVTLKFNRSHGIRLLKIYNSMFNATEGSIPAAGTTYAGQFVAFDNSNWVYSVTNGALATIGDKWLNFYTMLDNVRRQEYDLSSQRFDDYNFLQDKIKGTSIFSSDQYIYNNVWLEDFSNYVSPACKHIDGIQTSNLVTGLDLSQEHKWDIFITCAGAPQLNIYTFSVALRILNITPQGVLIQ